MKSLRLSCAFALVFSLSGCVAEPSPVDGSTEVGADEDVEEAGQALIGSAQAQVFGPEFGTPDFGNGLLRFGDAIASGDLNGDGAADMVVGITQANDGSIQSTGAITIFWGAPAVGASFGGLSTVGAKQLHQPGSGNPEPGDMFGWSLAIGDFNCDGHPDIAAGAPYDTPSSPAGAYEAGNVSIFYGPSFTSWQLFWQGSATTGVSEAEDHFGEVLAAGNFNGDTSSGHACDDLAIGTPDEDIGSIVDAGAVTILYGRSTGLNTAGAPAPQLWHQDVGSLFGVAEAYDGFGQALVAGDFNVAVDGRDDLAIGVPYEGYESAGQDSVGLIQILKGSSTGLTDSGSYALELTDFAGLSPQDARMGFSLARGDFDGDGDDDLAAGAPFLSAGADTHAGAVLIYRQSSALLTASLRYDQDTANVEGVREGFDLCGFSLAAGDFDGDGRDDLASGCPTEGATASGSMEGALNVAYFELIPGSLAVAQAQIWHKSSSGIPDQCTSYDSFSWGLSSGDYNGDGETDLAATSLGHDGLGGPAIHGTVNVFYGAP